MTLDYSPHRKLPVAFAPLLEQLQTFQKEVIAWSDMEKGATRKAEADRLKTFYFDIVERAPMTTADTITEQEADLAFVQGVIRSMRLRETIIDETGIVDTYGSETIEHFDVDFRGDAGDTDRVLDALREVTGLDDDELAEFVEDFEEGEFDDVKDRVDIIGAIGRLYDLENRDDIRRLFSDFYPHTALPNTIDVTAIRTATSIFFCVPFESVAHLSESEARESQEPLANLWSRVIDLRQRDMAHFPVFGFFEAENMEDEVVQKMAAEAGYNWIHVEQLLTTMISILPAEEVDKYIVHDAWGHQWQALLFAFEDSYDETAGFIDPPSRYQSRPTLDPEHEEVELQELIQQNRSDEFEAFMEEELEYRLVTSVSGLFAEVLADAMEYKFLRLREDLRQKMPSSSFLKMLPTKLDLTLHDLPIYVRFACRGMHVSESEFPEFKESLKTTEETTRQIVEIMDRLVEEAKDFDFRIEGDFVVLNETAQLALQFFELVLAYNDMIEDSRLTAETSPVFKRHYDLLLFTTASYFESHPLKHFWEIDTFLREKFVPRYLALQKALRAAT